jgi:hypothetical protein
MNDLVHISALARPDFSKPFYIDVDTAASSSTSAVLSQRVDAADPDSHIPLAFRSRVLGGSEPGYPIRDQEGLGLVEALQEWRSTILGCEVIIRTDHKSLQWLMKTRHPDGSRIAGYALKVQEFNLTIEWNAATSKNIVAVDCFTRPPWKGNSPALTDSKQELAYDEIMASQVHSFALRVSQFDIHITGKVQPGSSALHLLGHESAVGRKTVCNVLLLMVVEGPLAGEYQILVEHHDGKLVLPGVIVEAASSVTYRSQLSQRMQEVYHDFQPEILRGARKHRTFHSVSPAEEDPERAIVFVTCLRLARKSTSWKLQGSTVTHGLAPLDFALARSMHEDLEGSLLKCFLKALGGQLPSLPRYHLRPSLDSMFRPAVRIAAVEPSSPHRIPTVQDAPNGPALCSTVADCELAVSRLVARLRRHTHLSCAVDLEGDLPSQVHLLQISVRGLSGSGDVSQRGQADQSLLCYVLDIVEAPGVLQRQGEDSLRWILEASHIVKSMHCCRGDTAALYGEFGIRTAGVFDTGVADCILRSVRLNKPRGLGKVLKENLGEVVQLSHRLSCRTGFLAWQIPEAASVTHRLPVLGGRCEVEQRVV